MKYFSETRVISKNVITDFVQGIRNMLGLRLVSYEVAINNTQKELLDKYSVQDIKWFRLDIVQITNGAFSITIYGELNG